MKKNVKELFDLTGKTAIVTGGSRGIGKEMAEALAEAGANVMICARRQEWLDATVSEFESRGFNTASRLCDVNVRLGRYFGEQRRYLMGLDASGNAAGTMAKGDRCKPDGLLSVRSGRRARDAEEK